MVYLRRVSIILFVIHLDDYLVLQIPLMVISCLSMLVYLCTFRSTWVIFPVSSWISQLLNELVLYVLSIFVYAFCDFMDETTQKGEYSFGMFVIACIIALILFNLINMIYLSSQKLRQSHIRRQQIKAKHRRMQSKQTAKELTKKKKKG